MSQKKMVIDRSATGHNFRNMETAKFLSQHFDMTALVEHAETLMGFLSEVSTIKASGATTEGVLHKVFQEDDSTTGGSEALTDDMDWTTKGDDEPNEYDFGDGFCVPDDFVEYRDTTAEEDALDLAEKRHKANRKRRREAKVRREYEEELEKLRKKVRKYKSRATKAVTSKEVFVIIE